MDRAYKEEDIEKLDRYQSSDFIHPHLKWINFLSNQLGEDSFFNGPVKIEGHNVYRNSDGYWTAKGSVNWGWLDDNGFDSGYDSGIAALDAIKKDLREKAEEGNEKAILFIKEWEANFNKW